MSDRGLPTKLLSKGPLFVKADPGLAHRMIANLFDNELKHVPPACTVTVDLHSEDNEAVLTLMDDGKGFDPAVLAQLFMRRVKSTLSTGHGLGLAFVDAVVPPWRLYPCFEPPRVGNPDSDTPCPRACAPALCLGKRRCPPAGQRLGRLQACRECARTDKENKGLGREFPLPV